MNMWNILTSKFNLKSLSMVLMSLKWLQLWLKFNTYGINQNCKLNTPKTNIYRKKKKKKKKKKKFIFIFQRIALNFLARIPNEINHGVQEHVRLDYKNKQLLAGKSFGIILYFYQHSFGSEPGLRPLTTSSCTKKLKNILENTKKFLQ